MRYTKERKLKLVITRLWYAKITMLQKLTIQLPKMYREIGRNILRRQFIWLFIARKATRLMMSLQTTENATKLTLGKHLKRKKRNLIEAKLKRTEEKGNVHQQKGKERSQSNGEI